MFCKFFRDICSECITSEPSHPGKDVWNNDAAAYVVNYRIDYRTGGKLADLQNHHSPKKN